MIGEVISHYRILEKLGAGGMGEVWKAEDLKLHRPVALKIMLGAQHSDEARKRFVREAQAASSLNHPHIATIYEIDEFERDGESHSFIAMEFISGKTLNEYARAHTPSVAQKLEIIEQIADALAEAHEHGVIHRDVKASNVIVAEPMRVKVLDFGLAKILDVPKPSGLTASEFKTELLQTTPGKVMGTLAYMSPEQALGYDVDHRTDIFSLGVLAYELFTGRLPFEGRTSLAMADSILHADPVALSKLNLDVTADLERIVQRMLEKERERRQRTLREVISEFAAVRWLMANPFTGPFPGVTNDDSPKSFDPYQTHSSYNLSGLSGLAGARPGTRSLGARSEKSVAVMNFINITRNPDDEWLGVGMAETVTADLKNIQGITVIGREVMYEVLRHLSADRKSDFDEKFATQVGREVGARYIIGGGYQRLGELLRITARVVAVETGEIISTVKIDGRLSELFDLQDKIVFELSQNLNLSLDSGEREVIEQDETQVIAAFEAFSKGMMELRSVSRDGIDHAIAEFEKAIALDPKYARAHAAHGLACELKAQFQAAPELLETAITSFQKAIELKPMMADAYSGLGFTFILMDRIDEAIGAIRRALAFAPNNPDALSALARAHIMGKGDFQTAAVVLEKALAANAKAGWIVLQLVYCQAWLGNYARAEELARKAVELQENFMSGTDGIQIVGAYSRLGYVNYLQGRYDDAEAQLFKELVFLRRVDHSLRERTMIEVNQRLTSVYVRQNNLDEAQRTYQQVLTAFDERLRQNADDPFTRYYVACACAMMGDREQAFEHLEKAIHRRRAYMVARAKIEPDFESLRNDERFQALLS